VVGLARAVLYQEVDIVNLGSHLRNFEWSRIFTPSFLELGESAYEGGEAGFVVLAVEPCSMPGENFSREDQENQLEVSLLAYAT
jgi:hypothetical protein